MLDGTEKEMRVDRLAFLGQVAMMSNTATTANVGGQSVEFGWIKTELLREARFPSCTGVDDHAFLPRPNILFQKVL